MKLIYRIVARVFITLTIILSIWTSVFYLIITNEVYDEIDDNLEDYSQTIINRFNSGDSLPERDNGTNNSYHIELISSTYIDVEQSSLFLDEMIYIEAKDETEPARVLKTIFRANNGKTYLLLVYTPSIENEDLIESILYSIIYLFILLLLSIIAINIWVYKTSMSPMYKILDWLKAYKIGDTNTTLENTTDIVEFKRLNDAIRSSIIRIEESYLAQKDFIGNASHEMQTPLAVCQNRLEALLETELKEYQLGEILKVQNTIDYMRRLNKTLLLLSQIDNHQFIDKDRVNLNEIVSNVVYDFKDIYASQHIKLNIIEEASLVVDMNLNLAKILTTNLIKNAFVHNISEGEIAVQIEKSKLIIRNSGNSSLDSVQIFKRFYQANRSPNSTGLGLAIVHSICKDNNFEIKYEYIDHKHNFSIIFA